MSLRIAGYVVPVGPVNPPESEAVAPYDPFNPSTTILKKGHRRNENCRAFTRDTVFEKDVAIPLRDRVKIYCDIFRPVTDEKTPVILLWSPYGKSGNGPYGLDMIPGRFGIPKEELSGYEKFEGLDPALWTGAGFAIVNVDYRGVWDSEGVAPWLGEQDGKDGFDAIEYLAALDWCNGKVGMAGNSWLAMSQWFIAAQQPPHLAAIAPWEGASDFYRDTLSRGGVSYPSDSMWGLLESSTAGRHGAESIMGMLEKYPLYNDYWKDKCAKLHRITAPAYVLASYSSSLHTTGSLRGFKDMSSKEKWLRIHPTQEWADLYSHDSVHELQKFFDYYLKGIKNDWPETPQIRMPILHFNKDPIANIPVPSYPVRETSNTKLYLAPSGQMTANPAKESKNASYRADLAPNVPEAAAEEVVFSYKFTQPTWLVGYSWLVVHLSSDQADADVFVQLCKFDKSGKPLVNANVPPEKLIPPAEDISKMKDVCFLKYLGPNGVLKASHAVTRTSKDNTWPEYSHDDRQLLHPGSIVRLEIPIWPTGMGFEAGESLAVKVSGHYMSLMEFDFLHGKTHRNKGTHTIHFGGQYDSYLVVPLMDPIVT